MTDPRVKALRLTQLQLIGALARSGSLTDAAKQIRSVSRMLPASSQPSMSPSLRPSRHWP
jgi:hypothetical protein